MTKPRDGLYVWVTWLSKLMAGEVGCQWAPWFRTHHTNYARAPSDFQLAIWTMEHTELLDELSKERSGLGESTYREEQNRFRVRRSTGLVVAGKPDLIAIDKDGHCTVYDCKTGKPRQSDIIQVMLYMMLLPYASPLYKGKNLSGCVVYKTGTRSGIPAKAIDQAFIETITHFINILESSNPPKPTPHLNECRFCDITDQDCSERVETDDTNSEGEAPEVPI